MMFINSIFLPKNISDHTLSEGISGNIGNFSHLFSNVFRIVNDEQESAIPIKLLNVETDSDTNTQNQLLTISLLSDNKLTQENTSISMLVSLFMSKIKPGEDVPELADANKVKVSEKTPKYFSLNKNELIKEIKNIIASLKNGDEKNLKNVEISLIANGNAIRINHLTTNIADLENWISDQMQTNSDFELVVKTNQDKLAVDVEQIKNEATITEKPTEIISIIKDDSANLEITSFNRKNIVDAASIDKSGNLYQSVIQEPIKGSKPTVQIVEKQSNASEIGAFKTKMGKSVFVDLKTENDINTELSSHNSVKIDSAIKHNLVDSKTNSNNFVSEKELELKSGFGKELNPKMLNEIIPELKAATQSDVEKSTTQSFKNIQSEYLVSSQVKSSNVKSQIKSNDLNINPDTKKIFSAKSKSELNEYETIQPAKTISVKSNQKINSISLNNTTTEEKVVLSDLMDKTNVKEIKVNLQTILKTSGIKNSKNLSSENSEPLINKNNSLNENTIIDKDVVRKSAVYNNEIGKVNANSITQKINNNGPQQELFSESEFVENETNHLLKNDFVKTNVTTIRPPKEVFVSNIDTSLKNGSKELEKIKSIFDASNKSDDDQNPVDFKSNPHKPINKIEFISNENVETKNLKVVEGTKDNLTETKKVETDSSKIQVAKNDSENKQKPVEIKSNTKITTTEIEEAKISTPIKDSVNVKVKESIKEIIKEPVSVKTNLNNVSKESENKDFPYNINDEKTVKNGKEQTVIDNYKKDFVELSETEPKNEAVVKNQPESKNIKVDFMQRRVYSQIPKLEVIADNVELKNVNSAKSFDLNTESNSTEKVQLLDEPIKSISNPIETKPKNEKQVWVKVSLEKNENEVVSEARKSVHQQNKITIDASTDDVKKDFTPNSNSEKESHENPKQKQQTVSVEAVQNNEQKPVVQNQTTTNQNETTVSIKPELKTEHNVFKSELHNQETKFTSRQAEMVERVKVISSGEMVREVYKVLENGEKQSIVLKLVPKELGAIKVMLDTVDSVLTANVEVENESVGTVIRNNVEQLKHNLAQSGVHVNSINISYHNSDQKQHGFNNQKRKNPAYLQNNSAEEVDETIVTKKMGYNTYEYLA